MVWDYIEYYYSGYYIVMPELASKKISDLCDAFKLLTLVCYYSKYIHRFRTRPGGYTGFIGDYIIKAFFK